MKSMLIRTVKTFAAAFVASAATGIATMAETGFTGWQTAVITVMLSGIAAGITAILNLPFVKQFFKDYGENAIEDLRKQAIKEESKMDGADPAPETELS